MSPGPPNVDAGTPSRGSGAAACPATAGVRKTLTYRAHETPSRHLQGLAERRRDLRRPRTISRTTATPDATPHSVLPTVFGHCTPRFGGKRRLPRPHSCTPPLLVTIKGGGGLPLDGTLKTLLDISYRGHLHPRPSPHSTPLLTETWEFPSLSRLACTPTTSTPGAR